MAGNKITTKTKGKEDKNKNKSIGQINEDGEDFDFSMLRKPILTSVTGFAQARKIFDLATEELKGLISNECDLLYECKVCRNIFRSLANFISHKRIYCKETFKSTQHGYFFKTESVASELLKIKKLEETYLESLNCGKNGSEDVDLDEIDARIPLTKDLTTIIEKMVRNKGVCDNKYDSQSVVLQKIPHSSVAMFQSMDNTEEKLDRMKAQVIELDEIISKDKAVLQNDGTFVIQSSLSSETDNVIQISDDDDEITDGLKCKICEQKFSTQKTLKFHMKYKHLKSRLVYPCPDCLEIFSTSWSVYRHLFKVHRKSAAQIRRLRESIQAKAFKMNNPPAFYEKRKNVKPVTQKISEEERLDQENQAWLDKVEGDGTLPRCFGCGLRFERRAALAAHAHTCQPRSRALLRRPDKKIEIQIRKDYNKGPGARTVLKPPGNTENKTNGEEESRPGTKPVPSPVKDKEDDEKEDDENVNDAPMDVTDDDDRSNDASEESPEKSNDKLLLPKSQISLKLPFAHQAEKSNLTAFRQRIRPDIEVNTLLCKKCDIQHNTVQELYDHMAGHYKWMRYACKLCNFKTYYFSKLPEHVKMVHKLKGDTDFYFSTVKAIDGNEALELSENKEESTEVNNISPGSRRQSRCSSDSSRLSDDSSSSSARTELGSRKRKMFANKSSAKRKKDDDDDGSKAKMSPDKDNNSMTMDETSMSKTFEENSSDMDDLDEKNVKRQMVISSSVASRRPVRKKTKRKNEDFEYDLSNLLKMEAQGYRDSQSSTTNPKSTQNKKKNTQHENQNFYEIINRDCCGALSTMSKRAVETASAHIKNTNFNYVTQKDPRSSNIFVRPMIPKILSRAEKSSPKKDIVEDTKDTPNQQKELTATRESTVIEPIVKEPEVRETTDKKSTVKDTIVKEPKIIKNVTEETADHSDNDQNKVSQDAKVVLNKDVIATSSSDNSANEKVAIPAVVPFKFRRQSLELIKNPIINKNITDFKKAGMKTKILVIKPINRIKDGKSMPNTPLKFQTIKLKEPSKSSSSTEEKPSDQVVVVKVPKVDTISRTVMYSNTENNEKPAPVKMNACNNNVTNIINDEDLKSDNKNETSETNSINNDEFNIKSSTSNVGKRQTVDSTPVSDAEELIVDNEEIVEENMINSM